MLTVLRMRGLGWALLVGVAGAALLALIARGLLGHTPHYDELLHVLSARGLLQFGAPVIAEGSYPRAEVFTRLVAWSFRLFGDSLEAARLPALGAGAVLVFFVGAWVTSRAGLLAGAAAAILLCVVPMSVSMAVFARFYTLHALVVTLMFVALFEAMEPDRSWLRRCVLAVLAVVLMPLAWHLQATTIIALGAGMAGVFALFLLDRWTLFKPFVLTYPVMVIGGVALVAAIVLWGVAYLGLLDRLGDTALWAASQAERRQYYLVGLGRDLPLLWPLLPIAAALGLAHPGFRRLALFSLVVVGTSLVIHSVAAQKAMRYVYYLVPWMCVLWSCALAAVILRSDESQPRILAARSALPPLVVLVLLGAGFVVSVEGNRTMNLAAGRLAAITELPYRDEPDWEPVAAELAARAELAEQVVTSNSMKALYYLGRYDYELNATIVPETDSGLDFGVDPRTGSRAIGEPGSIERVLDRPGTTLVVLEESKIGRHSGVPAESFAVIESRCSELELPAGTRVRAWTCGTRD
jgi:hypothetical protein